MRRGSFSLVAVLSLILARAASAACPGPECLGGGGPPTTDCIVTWTGIPATVMPCVDGSACDQDGIADGVCTFPIEACLGADPACGVTAVTSARVAPAKLSGSAALQAAISALAPGQCTAPGFAVPVKRSAGLGPIRPGVARVKVLVVADGKRDPDTLRLTCQPAAPSFAAVMQPILTSRCTQGACHDATYRSQELDLSAGAAYASLVGRKATTLGVNSLLVAPRVIAKSFVARKITGKGLKPANGSMMPQGCPGFPPAGGCLDDAEIYTILAWIQSGAPNN
jgi:hypothetical protein